MTHLFSKKSVPALLTVGLLSTLLALSLSTGAVSMAATPTPSYQVENTADQTENQARHIEIRQYPALVVAETTTQGNREEAAKEAVRILAGYIFGDNRSRQSEVVPSSSRVTAKSLSSEKLAMTAPVIQQKQTASALTAPSEKLAMTAPVLQQQPAMGTNNARQWQMQFVMPEGETLETLPVPNHPGIVLKQEPAKRVVAIRFSGTSSEKNLSKHLAELQTYVAQNNLSVQGEPAYAFYNPPWTLPFLRRNEIMLTLKP